MTVLTPDDRDTLAVETPPLVDLRQFIRPGDTILWGQGTGEPQTLSEALVAQRARLGGVQVFLGSAFTTTLQPDYADHLSFVGIGGLGSNSALTRAGVLDVLPCHISAVPRLIESGRLRVDVVLVQVSPRGSNGRHSLGIVADYLPAAIASARTVIAEVNDQVPCTLGDCWLDAADVDHFVYTSRPPVSLAPASPTPADDRIGALIADLVPDGAVLQLGIGHMPQAVTRYLMDKKELGVHSGVVGDWLVDLMEAGVVTNRRKPIDAGISITGALFGSRRLYDFANENPALELRPLSYTHDGTVLNNLDMLVAINTALEVDLTGQVNAETVAGAHVGAVGGQVDFVRAALRAARGRSIIALPSTARRGQVSRIVAKLSDGVTTAPRSDADLVVTEHGVADIRGLPIGERIKRMVAIADPRFREELESALHSCPPV